MRSIELLGRLGPHGIRWVGMRGTGSAVIGRDEILDALASVTDEVGQALLLIAVPMIGATPTWSTARLGSNWILSTSASASNSRPSNSERAG